MSEERKLVSVLFADVIGSTALSESLDPERLRTILDSYFAAMAEAIGVWGGTVEKFIGDAIVAVFGVPLVREDDAERALRAALDMLNRLDRLNHDLERTHGIALHIRIGVNTGEVLASTRSGLDQRLVSGDTVNIAARLQETAEPGTVLVGERTCLATRGSFTFAEPVDLALKGKGQAIRARRLAGVRSEGTRGVEGLNSAMVGRQTELQVLSSLLEDVMSSGKPRLVTVLGQAGIGKSRLVREFVRLAEERQAGARVLGGRCLAAGQGITFWALAEILRSACGISLDDPVEVLAGKLEAAAGSALRAAGASEPEIERTIFALAMTAGIALPGNQLAGLDSEAATDELGRAWARFVSASTAGGLALLVVEDLHWAGDALVEVLVRVVARSTGPMLVVATARPEFTEKYPNFGGGSEDFSTVTLRALSARHTQELIASLLQVAKLPEEVPGSILATAEGNPYFVEEILQRLIESGALVRDDGRWIATEAAGRVPLPESLQALLAARIDALAPREKQVLQEAAIVGRVFWEQPLARGIELADVRAGLGELERRGFIFAHLDSSLSGQAEFSFKHALLRDVAYAGVTKARRARAHAQTAQWIEELAGGRMEEFAELLAYHYEVAAGGDGADLAWPDQGDRESVRSTAFEHLLFAGDVARKRFAVTKAIELHESAQALAGGDQDRMHAFEELADDHDSAYHGDAAAGLYEQALDLARSDPLLASVRSRLCWKLARSMVMTPGAFSINPDPMRAERLIAEGLASAPDDVSRARLLVARGALARLFRGTEPFGQGEAPDPVPVEERIEAVTEAMEIAQTLQQGDLLASSRWSLGILYGVAGRYAETVQLWRTELEQMKPTLPRLERADILRRVAVNAIDISGDFIEGLQLAQQSYALTQDSNPHQLMHATWGLLVALYQLGRWQDMPAILEEHVAAFREDPAVLCQFVREGPAIGATLFANAGKTERGRELASLLGDPRADLDGASPWQALYAVVSGDPETALAIAEAKALQRNRNGPQHAVAAVEALVALQEWVKLAAFLPQVRQQIDGNALLRPVCDRAEGAMAAAAGDRDAAATALRRALAGFEKLGLPFEVARTKELLAKLVGGEEGRSLAEAALAEYERLGAAPHAERVRTALV